MELWKGAAIGAMLLAIVGYGVAQNRPANTGINPEQQGQQGTTSLTPAPQPAVESWIGKEPIAWDFPASAWANSAKPLTKADLKGKVSLLEFWRMGCSHCEDAVPFMNALKKQYGTRLQMVTFQSPGLIDDPENPENSWGKVKEWMNQHAVSYPVAFDTGRKLKDQYNVNLYPFVMLVNKDGKIVYAHTGHTEEKARDLTQQIQKLVGK